MTKNDSCSSFRQAHRWVFLAGAISLIAAPTSTSATPPPAGGAVIQVTDFTEKVNGRGGCSLQEAIYAANFGASNTIDGLNPDNSDNVVPSTCVLQPDGSDAYTIVLPFGSVFPMDHFIDDAHNFVGPTATPMVTSTIIIEATGARLEHVGSVNFRAFAVAGTGDLTLKNAYIKGFTVKGGDGVDGGGGGMGAGGAIYVQAGRLTIDSSTFEGNRAVGGNGGVGTGTGLNGQAATGGGGGGLAGNGGHGVFLEFRNNDVGGGGGGGGARGTGGAAILNFLAGAGGGGTVRAGNSRGNLDRQGGPGGFDCGGKGGNFEDSGDDGPCAGGGGGGGGYNDITLGSSNGGKGSYGGGGGGGGDSNIGASGGFGDGGQGGFGGGGGSGELFTEGSSGGGGNGGFGGGGGAGDSPGSGGGPFAGAAGTFTSSDEFPTTVFGGGGGAALGGAIFNDSGTVKISNSTFTANSALRGEKGATKAIDGADAGSDGADAGAAIFSLDGSLSVFNATISGNNGSGAGAGIVVYQPTSFELHNTIVANNEEHACQVFESSVPPVGENNLIQNNDSCPGLLTAADPQLDVLQLNAPGLTPTMAIGSTSPAANNADRTTSLPVDQRGVTRPQPPGGGFDIGAYEFIVPSADLSVAKSTLNTAVAGQDLAYAIEVVNFGPTDAANVTITDTLPPGTTLVSVVGSGGFSCSGTSTIQCTKASMDLDAIALLTLTVHVPASVADGTLITNTVSVTSTTPDPVPANNTASVTADVMAIADVSVTKTGPSAPLAGADVSYTITATNSGPSDAQGVTVSDIIAANTTFTSLSAPAGWSCVAPAAGTPGPAPISCTRATFTAGATASFALVVHLRPSTTNGSQLCNSASIVTTTIDPNSSNNASQTCGTVRALADLALTQGATTTGSPGKGMATFTLTVTNNGPSDSQNIVLVATSSLFSSPAPAINASAGGTCTVAVSTVTCTWATLPLLANDTVVISVPWRSAVGQVCDSGSVSAGTPDPNAVNNTSTVCIGKKTK